MADAGIFSHDARIELIDGELIESVAPMYPPHASGVAVLNRTLVRRLGERSSIRCQLPVTLGGYSEPEPDFAVVKAEAREYRDRHPGPDDIQLLVEVADSSRDEDRRMKIPLYARFGIPESWLVDLVDDHVVVYRNPGPRGYRTTSAHDRGEEIALLAFPGVPIPVDEMLPPR